MTYFIHGLLVGFALCFIAFCVLGALLLAHRAPPVTLQRRKYRDAPDRQPEAATTAEVGGVRYEHLGMTGYEQ
ncbi:hypothetical protein [Paraburkholderia atlantica]|uniref:hypothetical protein n=1 Tax=Paraburkholderia atlantica TaxID=2654982 RepID=UPI001621009B|nr:hypothetical protein [Paraburkholderia atlantica]MBB5414086.1 hypothetical protein [Paraburkholderia atlantica]